MKLLLILSLFVCSYASPLRKGLIERAKSLDEVIKAEINKLKAEKREHISVLLHDEQNRLDNLSAALAKLNDNDPKAAALENELTNLESRITNEIDLLKQDAATQELLVKNAEILKQNVAQSLRKLQLSGLDPRNPEVIEVGRQLSAQEQRVEQLVQQLINAQDQKQIENLEVELRVAEVRLNETLKHQDILTATSTVRPSTKPALPNKPTIHTTARPPTQRLTTHPPIVEITTVHPATTPNPIQTKAELMKKATELENYANTEIERLKKENRITLAKNLQSLQLEVKEVAAKLQKTDTKEILELIESELYWLERRLAIETEALVEQEKRIQRLLNEALALKIRLDSSIKVLANTPVGKALESEVKNLAKVSNDLKNAKDDKSIINMEIELALIEKRVNDELRPIGIPTTKKFIF